MPGDGPVHAISELVSRFGPRRAPSDLTSDAETTDAAGDAVFPTRALRSFLASLRGRGAPVLLDLGPVVGANVMFLGEQLGCKLFVEDLCADLNRLTRQGAGSYSVGAFLQTRLAQEDASVDGVLCWDLLDYVDAAAGRILAAELVRVLRPGGALFVCFGAPARPALGQTKYEIVDESNLRHRFCPGARGKARALESREVTQLFRDLAIADSFLLSNRMREMLFRKAPARTTDSD